MQHNKCGFCNRPAEAKLTDGRATVKACIVHMVSANIDWHVVALLKDGRWVDATR